MAQAFVAMPFAIAFQPVYQTIKAACMQAGIKVIRIDEIIARDDIYKEIEREILKADFIIADFSGDRQPDIANPNVVHEAAFAYSHQKYIILMAQDPKCFPFDWKTRPGIIYKACPEGLDYLQSRLYAAIQALMQKEDFGKDLNQPFSSVVPKIQPYPMIGYNAPYQALYQANMPYQPYQPVNSFPPQNIPLSSNNSFATDVPFLPQNMAFASPASTYMPAISSQENNNTTKHFLENLLQSRETMRPQDIYNIPTNLPDGFLLQNGEIICQKDNMQMTLVPAGTFVMGGTDEDDQEPLHTIHLSPYLIDQYPITNHQYSLFMQQKGYSNPDYWTKESWEWKIKNNIQEPAYWDHEDYKNPNQPVIGVSWYEAQAYAIWSGKHLPTEAQWEYAAKGNDQRPYPWGTNKPTSEHAHYKDTTKQLQPIATAQQGISPFQCHDMAGNVWEWCYDWYKEDYYQDTPNTNPIGPHTEPEDQTKTSRGGSWNYTCETLKTYYRFNGDVTLRNKAYGFRCARIL
ncbi:MAG: SUMF1/EgtB/PvdO family nonheme iron enzyme [Planctomycetes bacterium]|jgi:formylglycine-generating enzyme required for sulfatase activity|nr:SUMF1/EgtB/PvdO family nonheme iron enzyme [Planctomycetota bacterium]